MESSEVQAVVKAANRDDLGVIVSYIFTGQKETERLEETKRLGPDVSCDYFGITGTQVDGFQTPFGVIHESITAINVDYPEQL